MSHGPLMLDLDGLEVTTEERELLAHPATGGVILFSRNFESPAQVAELVRQIHAVRSPPLLVAVDQEGGRVQRFRDGFTRLPPVAKFGQLFDRDHKRAQTITQEIGWLMAAELRAVGIDFSFAPVLDLDIGISEVIGDRAFHARPEVISQLGHAWIKGMHEAGMPAVGKHFPGHGCVEADSHLALPVDNRSYGEIEHNDLVPFRNLVSYGLDAIMPAHVVYPAVTPELAGFSSFWLDEVLRKRLGFQGVIFSDDLTMAAAGEAGGYPERAQAALDAGCDMVLVCNCREGVVEVLDALKDHRDPVSHSRLARMHGHSHYQWHNLPAMTRWHGALEMLEKIGAVQAYDLELHDPTEYQQ